MRTTGGDECASVGRSSESRPGDRRVPGAATRDQKSMPGFVPHRPFCAGLSRRISTRNEITRSPRVHSLAFLSYLPSSESVWVMMTRPVRLQRGWTFELGMRRIRIPCVELVFGSTGAPRVSSGLMRFDKVWVVISGRSKWKMPMKLSAEFT